MRVFYRHSLEIKRLDKHSLCGMLSARPTLAKWLDKPQWQLMVLTGAMLIGLAGGAYGVIIQALCHEQQQLGQDIVQNSQKVAAQYHTLLLRPSRALVDEKRHALLPQEKHRLPLTQQIAAPLVVSKAKLTQWLPQPADESSAPRSRLKVQMDYPALAVFLQKLLAGNTPPFIEQLSLNAVSGALDIDMLLSASGDSPERSSVPDVAISRDPFSLKTVKQCLERHDALSQAVLKGIVGSEARRTGWLAWPDGRWKKVRAGQLIDSTAWWVDAVAADRIVLTRQQRVNEEPSCGEYRKLMSLHPEKAPK